MLRRCRLPAHHGLGNLGPRWAASLRWSRCLSPAGVLASPDSRMTMRHAAGLRPFAGREASDERSCHFTAAEQTAIGAAQGTHLDKIRRIHPDAHHGGIPPLLRPPLLQDRQDGP
jgi:hypothetical protein